MARSILDFAQQNTELGVQTTKARTLQGTDETPRAETDQSNNLP
jgi:hypothetical protein